MRKKKMICGFCQSGIAHREDRSHPCPRVMRIARITPAGQELREIVCSCGCVDDE